MDTNGGPGRELPWERWESLYRRYHCSLRAHVEQLTDDRELAEDVTHEVFLAALVELGAGHIRPSWSWLRDLGTRLAVTRGDEIEAEPAGLPVSGGRPPEGEEEDERARTVAAAFAGLSARDRLVLSLRYQDHWTQAEIGRLLEIEQTSVADLLGRARRRLRLELQRAQGIGSSLVGWVGARRRRVALWAQRLPAVSDEGSMLLWRVLDRVQPLVGVMVTSAATFSLATALAVGSGGLSGLPARAARPLAVDGPAVAGPPARLGSDVHQVAEADAGTPRPSVRAALSPGVQTTRAGDQTRYRLDPAAASVDSPPVEMYQQYGPVAVPLGFSCPPPEERRPSQMVGCPALGLVAGALPAG